MIEIFDEYFNLLETHDVSCVQPVVQISQPIQDDVTVEGNPSDTIAYTLTRVAGVEDRPLYLLIKPPAS